MKALPCILLSLATGTAAAGSEGVLEINEDCVAVGCFAGDSAGYPVTISSSGRYRLSSDLLMVSATQKNGIEIAVAAGETVDLDLGGFTIDGLANCEGTPVTNCLTFANGGEGGVYSESAALIRIHDGTIRGMKNPGLTLNNFAGGSSVERLTVTECNASNDYIGAVILSSPSEAITAKDLRITRNRYGGLVATSQAVVVGATISGNSGYGLLASDTNVTVRESVFANNTGLGITSVFTLALGASSFFGNNGGGNNAQFTITTLRDMSDNVCGDGTCP